MSCVSTIAGRSDFSLLFLICGPAAFNLFSCLFLLLILVYLRKMRSWTSTISSSVHWLTRVAARLAISEQAKVKLTAHADMDAKYKNSTTATVGLALVDLKKRVEITKLRQARGNAENNIGHCDLAMDKILAKQPLDRPQLDQWQRQKFNWENVVREIEQIIQTQEQGYNRLLAGLNLGASLAMMEPVLIPTMPKAPEPPRDQSAQKAVLAPINVQMPIDRASPPNIRAAFHPGPPPGFSHGFESSNGRSTPAESTTSSITSGHSAPMKPVITYPQVHSVVKSSSFDKIIPQAPAARPAVQQPQPVQNDAKSADLIGKMFNALKDRFQNLDRSMVVAELLALKEQSGGKITTKMNDTIELIAQSIATKLPKALPPPPDPSATVHRTISDRDNECMICQEEMGFKNLVECKECREKYHDHCVNTWLKQKMNCPKCRAHLTCTRLPPVEIDGAFTLNHMLF